MPPRHSKSLNVSQLFPAYVVGKDKDADIIVSSYSGDLATDHGRETRNLIGSQAYKNIFDTTLAPDSTAKGKWNTNGRGAYNAVGVGGSTTGRGAKYFIIDDPFKDRKEADSELIRDERWKWFRSVARTRLTPDGRMIIMHTRWHDDDLIGRLTNEDDWVDYFDFLDGKKGKWIRLRLPALAERDEIHRLKGAPLWPTRYGLDELNDIKKTLGPYEWSSLYQQDPIDVGSQEIRTDWFKYRSLNEVLKMQTRKFATIDPAGSLKDDSDFTGVCRNYVDTANCWNIDVKRYKINSTGMIDLIFDLHDEGFELIGIEEGIYTLALEPVLKKEMEQRKKYPNMVLLKHQQTQKETRIRGIVPRYENGKIFHIEGRCEDLENEAARFPKGKHDDCLDAVAYQNQIAEPPSVDSEDFGMYGTNFQ